MQTIKYDSMHPIAKEIYKLYAYTSEKDHTQQHHLLDNGVTVFSTCFESMLGFFDKYSNVNFNVEFTPREYERLEASEHDANKILVLFSGGKDSTATALYYKHRGYDVTLYHLKGINQTYRDEYRSAQRVAERLELPIVFDEIKLTGRHDYIEHPLKNLVLFSCALQYALRHDLSVNLATGNFSSSVLDAVPFEVCGGDSNDMLRESEHILKQICGECVIRTPLYNMDDSVQEILQYSNTKELLFDIQSCIGPYRFRERLRQHNIEKYHVQIPAHRCGSCWKCCVEYCIFSDNGVLEYNREYYKHCLEVLKKTILSESGRRVRNLRDVWSEYFFYDINNSKYFSEECIND